MKYLQTSKYCPMCNTKIHETQPLLNLKLDRVMQDIVYKLVPGLQESECPRAAPPGSLAGERALRGGSGGAGLRLCTSQVTMWAGDPLPPPQMPRRDAAGSGAGRPGLGRGGASAQLRSPASSLRALVSGFCSVVLSRGAGSRGQLRAVSPGPGSERQRSEGGRQAGGDECKVAHAGGAPD